MSLRSGSDIGGTFTDVVVFDPSRNEVVIAKVLTTPSFTDGVVDGLLQASGDIRDLEAVVHGSTVVINALLERTGSRTALLTTRGFRDVYEIGRVNRPDAYNLRFVKHTPLVERSLRLEIDERISPSYRRELDPSSVAAAVRDLQERGVQAVAIAFLHSFADPSHEQEAKRLVDELMPNAYVTASHEVSREYRELERTSTVVANAYVGQRMSRYLDAMEESLADRGFTGSLSLMQSNGGLSSPQVARDSPVTLVESGPAAGVIGAASMARSIGIHSLVAFDMGGTTAKAGVVVDGVPRLSHEYFLGGYGSGLPLQVPVMDIHEVGTGGGSLAEVTTYGELRVGPRSAGSVPGPASYGLGGERPTVTDANVLLGRLHPDAPLSGGLVLEEEKAREAVQAHVSQPLGIDLEQAALGIVDVAVASMAHTISTVTVQRGLDPSLMTLCAYGGAGPVHATQVARACGMSKVIIPSMAGVFSAYGMLFTDVESHRSRTQVTPLSEGSQTELVELAEQIDVEIRGELGDDMVLELSADMRYVGQEHTVTVPVERHELANDLSAVRTRFDAAHANMFSHADDGPAEIVTLRAVGRLVQPKPQIAPLVEATGPAEPFMRRRVFVNAAQGWQVTPFFAREELGAGADVKGPAVVVESTCSTFLRPGDVLHVDPSGALIIDVDQ